MGTRERAWVGLPTTRGEMKDTDKRAGGGEVGAIRSRKRSAESAGCVVCSAVRHPPAASQPADRLAAAARVAAAAAVLGERGVKRAGGGWPAEAAAA